MEREKLISTLQEKVGQSDFSVQTLGGIIDMNPLADGAEPDDAYWERTMSFVRTLQGQYNHDFSTKFQTEVDKRVEDFKRTYKPADPNTPPTTPPTEPKQNKEVEELKKQIEELKAQNLEKEEAARQGELLKKVRAAMRAQNANDAYVLDKTLQGVKFDTAKTVEELTAEMLKAYDKEFTQCRGGGMPPRVAKEEGKHETAASRYFEKKAKKEGWGSQK